MKQNPFSIYDFLGYVFPGALSIFLIFFFYQVKYPITLNNILENGVSFISTPKGKGGLEIIEDTLVLTIIAYVVGHIVAYLSSITIEQYSQWLFGYPSFFLLNKAPNWLYWRIGENRISGKFQWPNKFIDWGELLLRVLMGLFLFPITLCYLLFGKVLGMKNYFVKPLDKTLTIAIKNNEDKLARSLGIEKKEGDDFHRVIYHYVYENQKNHVIKMDNYVALYGFLRALTFIMVCSTLWIAYANVVSSFNYLPHINFPTLAILFISILLTYICFMGFMKFYRRFTLESFMCLVIDTSYKDVEKIPHSYNCTSKLSSDYISSNTDSEVSNYTSSKFTTDGISETISRNSN